MANAHTESIITVLSPKTVAQLLGISLATLYRWIGKGIFPPSFPLGPRRVGFRMTEVEDWLAQRAARSTDNAAT